MAPLTELRERGSAWRAACGAILGLLLLPAAAHAAATAAADAVRIGLTPVFPEGQTGVLRAWRGYLSRRLQQPVEFVQRHSYREVTDLLLSGDLDAAWVCGPPYLRHSDVLRLLAVPVFEGEPLYRSYLIVPVADDKTRSITDLKARVFAYSDPDSNSGYLVPQVALRRAGVDPHHFFRKEFFTWSHSAVVIAVAEGVAEGGAVDSYVWETLNRTNPELTARTRVVTRSERYGFPPLVAPISLPQARFQALQKVLLDMAADPEGRRLLGELNLDGFTRGDARLFDGIRAALRYADGG